MAQPTMKLLLFITALITISNGFSLQPMVYYSGRPAREPMVQPMELVFIIDSSESIGFGNFERVKESVADVVKQHTIGPNDIRIGLVQYSSRATVEFNLNRYSTKQRIIDHIRAIQYIGEGTFIGTAIRVATQQVFSDTRDGVRKVAIVITGGTQHPRDKLQEAVREAHSANIAMYAVGIHAGTEQVLKLIASYPHKRYVRNIEDIGRLLKALEEIVLDCGCEDVVTRTVTRTDPRCSLPREEGRCQDYTLNWYYDSAKQACAYFWYGGCDGNANRFKTQEECGNACPPTRTVSRGPDPRCNLPKDAGPCTDYTRQTYYDKQTNACVSFWYGGCRGNANRFETQGECSKTCVA